MTASGRGDLVLVDSSAWISFFARTGQTVLKATLRTLLDEDRVATAGPVALEILQGCRSEPEQERLARVLQALHWLRVDDGHWHVAGTLAFRLRRQGITVGAIDVLIATLAEGYGCALLQQDRDFLHIARHSQLRLFRVG